MSHMGNKDERHMEILSYTFSVNLKLHQNKKLKFKKVMNENISPYYKIKSEVWDIVVT